MTYGPIPNWIAQPPGLYGPSQQALAEEQMRQELAMLTGQQRQAGANRMAGAAGGAAGRLLGAARRGPMPAAAAAPAYSSAGFTSPGPMQTPQFSPVPGNPAEMSQHLMRGGAQAATESPGMLSKLGGLMGTVGQIASVPALAYGTYQGFQTGKDIQAAGKAIRGLPQGEQRKPMQDLQKGAVTSTLGGAGAGAVSGATAGTAVLPGIGTAIGAVLGAVAGGAGAGAGGAKALGTKKMVAKTGEGLGRLALTAIRPDLLISKGWREKLKDIF